MPHQQSGGVKMRRPRAIVLDILGTASKSGFLERILFPFLKLNLETFVNEHWNSPSFIRLYNKIMEQSLEFHRQEPNTPIVLSHNSPQAKSSFLNFINFVTDNQIVAPSVTQLRFKVWFEGYQRNKIRTPIYSDVPNRMRQWFTDGIKFYVFSNTWVEAQKSLLRNTNHGDLTNLISGHYDNDFGSLTESDSWRRLCADIRLNPSDVLVLTKSPIEGKAALDAGLLVVLVLTHRHNVKAVSHEDRQRFPYVRTLNDLSWLEGAEAPMQMDSQVVATGAKSPPENIQGPIATAASIANTSQGSQSRQASVGKREDISGASFGRSASTSNKPSSRPE